MRHFGLDHQPDASKVAEIFVSIVTVTMHPLAPLQPPPDQPANVEPTAGLAVRVRVMLAGAEMLHWPGQLRPAGFEVTAPAPLTMVAELADARQPKWRLAGACRRKAPSAASARIQPLRVISSLAAMPRPFPAWWG